MENLVTILSLQRYADDQWQEAKATLTSECTLSIYVNDILHSRQTVSPSDLNAFVIGRLIADNVIHAVADIQSIRIDGNTMEARVVANSVCCDKPRYICSAEEPKWEISWLTQLSEALRRQTPLYSLCQNTHSCFLMQNGRVLKCMEDIGRHNAFDKIIGWADLARIPLETCIVFTSGRIPKDMVSKAIHIGLRILVSKAMPTAEAVLTARDHGIILLHISDGLGIMRFS